MQVYIVLALLPASYAVYHLSRTSADGSVPALSKLIESYSYYTDKWTARNTLHTTMIEQAAFDRNLFQNSKGSSHVNLRFPEYGKHDNRYIDHRLTRALEYSIPAPPTMFLQAKEETWTSWLQHYEKLNADENERKVKAMAAAESSK